METKLEKLSKSQVRLIIKIGPIEMSEYFQKAFAELSLNLNMPGFRKGRVPGAMAQKSIDPVKLSERVLEIVLPITYLRAVKEKNLTPLHNPKINVKEFGKDKSLLYEAEVDVMPEVSLADYHRLKLKTQ